MDQNLGEKTSQYGRLNTMSPLGEKKR